MVIFVEFLNLVLYSMIMAYVSPWVGERGEIHIVNYTKMINGHTFLEFFFLPYFLPKILKLPYFFKKLHSYPTFSDFLVKLHLELRGTLKSDEIFVLIIPRNFNSKLRGSFLIFFFSNFLNSPPSWLAWYFF